MLANALKIACFGVFSRGKWVVCANIVRYSIDRGYVHFFVSRQRNGTKENALRGSAPKYPVGLCAFCPSGTKVISTVASLLFFLGVQILTGLGLYAQSRKFVGFP